MKNLQFTALNAIAYNLGKVKKDITYILVDNTPEFVYVIYDNNGCYVRECKNISDIAKVFNITKGALSQYLKNNGYKTTKSDFKYKGYSIEYFNINEYIGGIENE